MGIVQYLILAILVPAVHPCIVLQHSYGEVSDDEELKIGSPLRFTCSLYNSTVQEHRSSSKDLILKRNSDELANVTIVDEYSVEYVVQNATTSDSGHYYCYVALELYAAPQLVCVSDISVGTEPPGVQNFTCISYGMRTLNCSWDPLPNKIKTTYEVSDFLEGNLRFRRKCALPKKSSCSWTLSSTPPYFVTQEALHFSVKGKNVLGTSEQSFVIPHYEIVLPGAPRNIRFKNITSTSLTVDVFAPEDFENGEFSDGLIYEITYFPVLFRPTEEKVVTVTAKINAQYLIEQLIPHTQYRFQVRCRLNFPGDKFMWSDFTFATERTKPDVPFQAPVVERSSFDVQVIGGNLSITLYWKAIPAEFENGNNFHYVITYHEHYIPSRFTRSVTKNLDNAVRVGNRTTHTFQNMAFGTAYMFKIRASNQEGVSLNDSAIIVVDKTEKLLPGPRDITVISHDQKIYDISWKPSILDTDTNYTLFWCETLKSPPGRCEGPLNWEYVHNATSHRLHVPNHHTNYQFAVAATRNYHTSGMYWAQCAVLYGVPYTVPEIELMSKNSTSLRVRWHHKCPAEKKVIKKFRVYHCPYHGKDCTASNWNKCTVNGSIQTDWPYETLTNTTHTEYVLGGLKPNTCHFVYIVAQTDAGLGKNSAVAAEKTMTSAPSDTPSNVFAEFLASKYNTPSIAVSFNAPRIPNGDINRYIIVYNRTSGDKSSFSKEVRVSDDHNGSQFSVTLLNNVFFYTNYSVEVIACVELACSEPSDADYVFTDVSEPGIIATPRVEVLDENVNISWDPPILPNGPLDLYEIEVFNSFTKSHTLYNVTGQNHFVMQKNCFITKNEEIFFKVRPVNLKDGTALHGDFSAPAKSVVCPRESRTGLMVAVSLGAAGMLVVIGVFIALCVKSRAKKAIIAKKTNVRLPKALESPFDNPLSSYDKFKKELKHEHDFGIPNGRYDRLSSEANGISADQTTRTTGRNLSGESNVSGQGPESISSANTTKTHNSMDSGAEVESPPSPDSLSSSDSANTTPLTIHATGVSKDSGLEKDVQLKHMCRNFTVLNGGNCMTGPDYTKAYVKNSVRAACLLPALGEDFCSNLLGSVSLSNSEPSVADFDISGTEPLVGPDDYTRCAVQLSRSVSNGLDFRPSVSPASPRRTKYGITYRPLKIRPAVDVRHMDHLNHPLVFSSFGVPVLPLSYDIEDAIGKLDESGDIYSKFTMVDPISDAIQVARANRPSVSRQSSADTNPSQYEDAIKSQYTAAPLTEAGPSHAWKSVPPDDSTKSLYRPFDGLISKAAVSKSPPSADESPLAKCEESAIAENNLLEADCPFDLDKVEFFPDATVEVDNGGNADLWDDMPIQLGDLNLLDMLNFKDISDGSFHNETEPEIPPQPKTASVGYVGFPQVLRAASNISTPSKAPV